MDQKLYQRLVEIRRAIHSHPEPAFAEFNTAAIIQNYLGELGVQCERMAKTGVVGTIYGNNPCKTVAIRADMDALPLQEIADCEYKSKNPGFMHACGHDAHVATILGAATLLTRRKNDLSCNVKLIFQPAEEGDGGALPMIEQGVLENPKVDCAVAFHVANHIPVGAVEVKHGPVMACPDKFAIEILGKSGHGAAPHGAVDPIAAGCGIINALYSRRALNPVVPQVITVCRFESGSFYNVIPDKALIEGTARAVDAKTREETVTFIKQAAQAVAQLHGVTCNVEYTYFYPPVVNDRTITQRMATAATAVLGESGVIWGDAPSMGGDDFAYFAERVPSAYVHLGSGNPSKGINQPLHNSSFDIDEECMMHGAKILAEFCMGTV